MWWLGVDWQTVAREASQQASGEMAALVSYLGNSVGRVRADAKAEARKEVLSLMDNLTVRRREIWDSFGPRIVALEQEVLALRNEPARLESIWAVVKNLKHDIDNLTREIEEKVNV